MAEGRSPSSKSGTQTADKNGSRGVPMTIVAGAQDAANFVKSTAGQAAERWPEAVAAAQTAASESQRALERMPNQGLIIGTSFSLGLGVGLFVSGANRFLVALALAPAGAMALTMFGRDQASMGAAIATSTSTRRSGRAE